MFSPVHHNDAQSLSSPHKQNWLNRVVVWGLLINRPSILIYVILLILYILFENKQNVFFNHSDTITWLKPRMLGKITIYTLNLLT